MIPDPLIFPALTASAWDAGEYALWMDTRGTTALVAEPGCPVAAAQSAALARYGITHTVHVSAGLNMVLLRAGHALPLTLPAVGSSWSGFNNTLTAALAEALNGGRDGL